ncbi:glycosyltransferase [Aminipila butyrica]|uniref:Glycosyltransferase n=1 Tax=Aminipila butyrica TaxID=433296 RepID=A0A858BQS0_9FIRM|nr:glycosyltransferase [Aminipila butyrica]QIB68173.1 glycosyltransferase [Aminipila butyrica]
MNNEDLVSVIIVSYNSENTIMQTLESIKSQTYNKVELIITDDASSDNTVELCKQWIANNQQRFIQCELIVSKENCGVAGNCNRGIEKALGEYIKLIAADDILINNYLEDMINGMGDHDIAFCYEYLFCESEELEKDVKYLKVAPESLETYRLSYKELYKKQLVRNDFNAPTALIRSRVFKSIGGYDENYPFMEDLPFWLKCVKTKQKICFVEIYGVFYRRSMKSISRGVSEFGIDVENEKQKKFKSDYDRFLKLRKKEMFKHGMIKQYYLTFGDEIYRDFKLKHPEKKIIKLILWLFTPFIKHDFLSRFLDNYFIQNQERLNKKYTVLQNYIEQKKEYYIKKNDYFRDFKKQQMNLIKKQKMKCRYMKLEQQDTVLYNDLKKNYKKNKNELRRNFRKQKYEIKKQNIKVTFLGWIILKWEVIIRRYYIILLEQKISPFICKLFLLLSPISIYHYIKHSINNFNNCVFKSIRSEDKTINFDILEIKYRTAPSFKGQIKIKNEWEYLLKRELALQKKYLNHKTKGPIKIVFVIHLLATISAVETIFIAMEKDKKFKPIILIVPGLQPGMESNYYYNDGLIEYIQEKGYNYALGYEKGNWHSIFEFDPDGVFFQTPYESQRHPIYSYSNVKAFPKIMYTPYGPWVMDKSVDDYISCGIDKNFFNTCWKMFADSLTIEIMQYAAPEYLSKCILTGTPKVDYVWKTSGIVDTYCWKNVKGKKIIWLPRWGIEEDRTSFLDYYRYFLNIIETKDINFVMRPHPLLWKDLKQSQVMSEKEIENIINQYDRENSFIDDGCYDYREGLLSCDFIIADFTSVIYEYIPTMKPIVYTPKDNTLINPLIMDVCYVVRNGNEMKSVIDDLLLGKDPMREKRKRLINQLNYFPNGKSNGEDIMEYIKTNIANN